jgi:pullulanase
MNRINAIATKENRIIVKVRKDFALKKPEHFHLLEDGKEVSVLTLSGETDSSSSKIYNFKPKSGLLYEPGRDYEVQTDDNFFVPLDISFLGRTEAFEKQYRYDGELGAIYTKGRTTFVLFAPFATKVVLLVTLPVKETRAYIMVRDRKTGVFSFPCNGNLDKASYQYMVTVFGETRTITDPYAYALAANARLSYVIDPEKVRNIPTNEEFLPPYAGKKEAIIYETHVRDMTSLTALPDKGTFNALSRKGIQTKNGLPIGLDYLASLGVSHIQIMPLSDFQTVDECHPEESYNWGYDPSYYFAPEGSFASDPEDPYSRVLELKNMVSCFPQGRTPSRHGRRLQPSLQLGSQSACLPPPQLCLKRERGRKPLQRNRLRKRHREPELHDPEAYHRQPFPLPGFLRRRRLPFRPHGNH